jgi:hypothetical protein
MPGQVYVFNAMPEPVTLLLNDHLVAVSIPGVSQADGYRASEVAVPRSPETVPSSGTFGTQNVVVAAIAGGPAFTFQIGIDPTRVPPNADLQLYIAFGDALLVTGHDAQTFSGGPAGQEELALVAEHTG